jgi:hypothetical protein
MCSCPISSGFEGEAHDPPQPRYLNALNCRIGCSFCPVMVRSSARPLGLSAAGADVVVGRGKLGNRFPQGALPDSSSVEECGSEDEILIPVFALRAR